MIAGPNTMRFHSLLTGLMMMPRIGSDHEEHKLRCLLNMSRFSLDTREQFFSWQVASDYHFLSCLPLPYVLASAKPS
jgi:hypothetical protein